MTLLNYLIKLGFSAKIANSYIKTGKVLVNDQVETLTNFKTKQSDKIIVKENKKYVSRGAYKLLEAIEVFNLDMKNKVVIDIGSSTGGFTQVALEEGARKIYAVDVGTNQLAYQLRQNPKIIVMEKTNVKTLAPKMFDEKIDLVVCDVSFISLNRVFDVLTKILNPTTKVLVLIKPQFQAPSKLVSNKGIVELVHHQKIIDQTIEYAKSQQFTFINSTPSPILGKNAKNQEYLALFERN